VGGQDDGAGFDIEGLMMLNISCLELGSIAECEMSQVFPAVEWTVKRVL